MRASGSRKSLTGRAHSASSRRMIFLFFPKDCVSSHLPSPSIFPCSPADPCIALVTKWPLSSNTFPFQGELYSAQWLFLNCWN